MANIEGIVDTEDDRSERESEHCVADERQRPDYCSCYCAKQIKNTACT